MEQPNTSSLFGQVKRVVVKVGSNVLTAPGSLNEKAIRSISSQISRLMDTGLEVILVSSGAMASGMKKIGIAERPVEIPKRQAVAAVGQGGLILAYEKAFGKFNKKVAQILLTSEDLSDRRRYLNTRNTFSTLLSWRIVPVINENDTVAVESIKFGDNDYLSARICLLLDADILIILTDIDGLYDKDPRTCDDAELIETVTTISKDIEKMAGDIPGALGTGGMSSKIMAARTVTSAGIPMVIANGMTPDILMKLFDGDPLGTRFLPREKRLAGKKRWIGYNSKPKGVIRIDAGAVQAVLHRGKSLLPIGVTGVEGDFDEGSPVSVVDVEGSDVGTGLVNYCASDIRKIMGIKTNRIESRLGQKTYDEIIHRDNLVITHQE